MSDDTTRQVLKELREIKTTLEQMRAAKGRRPFTDFADVPLVCSINDVARVLNVSTTVIYRKLREGRMIPAPMPKMISGKWQWSRKALINYLDGGYLRIGRSILWRAGAEDYADSGAHRQWKAIGNGEP